MIQELAPAEDILSLLVEENPTAEDIMKADIIRQPSPPPVLADVQNLVDNVSVLKEVESLPDELIRAESPLEVHVVRILYLISIR